MQKLQDNRIGKFNIRKCIKIPHFLTSLILSKKAGFLFSVFFVFYLFTGYSPIDFFTGTISALVEPNRTINLYAGFVRVEGQDTENGWWNEERVLGEEEVSENATIFSFSDTDSAIYSGGEASLVVSDFMFLKEDPEDDKGQATDNELENEEMDVVPEEDIFTEEELTQEEIEEVLENYEFPVSDPELGDDIFSDSAEVYGDEFSENEQDWMLDASTEINISTSSLLIEEEVDVYDLIEKIKSDDQDNLGSSALDLDNDEELGIKNQEFPSEADQPWVESSSTESDVEIVEEGEEISFVGRLKDLIKAYNPVPRLMVTAQEIISPEIETLEDLGELKEARIKFSFGMESGLDFVKPVESEKLKVESQELDTSGLDVVASSSPANEEREGDLVNNSDALSTSEILNSSNSLQSGGQAADRQVQNDIGGGVQNDTNNLSSSELYIEPIVETHDDASPQDGQDDGVEIVGEELNIIEINRNEESANQEELIIDSEVEVIEAEEESVEVEIEESVLDEDVISLLKNILKIKNAQAQVSLEAKIIVWYSTEIASGSNERIWYKLDELALESLSNMINGGYFDYDAPFLDSWDAIENLELKFEGVVDKESVFTAFLDSVWIEAEYEPNTDIEKIDKRQRWEEALDLLSQNLVFSVGEEGVLRFRYNKNENRIWDTLSEIIGVGNFWKGVNIKARLVDSRGREVEEPLTLIFEEGGEFEIRLPEMTELHPGKYTIRFIIEDNSGEELEVLELSQNFSWGVLAMNFNKSVYLQDEKAYIQMAVLDDNGHTICDADISMEIQDPNGGLTKFSTFDGSVERNSKCGADNVIDSPDYFAYYVLDRAGEYSVTMTASTSAGEKIINEILTVKKSLPFEIERLGPTRINPKADYAMTMRVHANTDFKGDLVEFVPSGFKIKNYELRIKNNEERDLFGTNYNFKEVDIDGLKKITWQDIEFLKGDEIEIQYVFDAPDRSPEFYLLGPASLSGASRVSTTSSGIIESIKNFVSGDRSIEFSEYRNWQIASDSYHKRAKTVSFVAGVYNGGATAGQNTNSDISFNSFNFRLAETGVDIKSAFVLYESQFAAYNNNDGVYSGYRLAFDSCQENCTALAFTGTGRVLNDNSNVLAYSGANSNKVRLLLDVTNETDLAAYTGGGVNFEGRVGYHIKAGSSLNSIASAKAMLVLTYTYDADSENVTNTVVYPLDSTNGTDRGTRQASQVGDCTYGSCPAFTYDMDIAEFPSYATSTYRLSQWFRFYEQNDNNSGNDVNADIRINSGTISSAFHNEAANGGDQGGMGAMYFPSMTDFDENISQTVEYRSLTGKNNHNHYMIGGEVFDTYIASSSAATSTRTVSFPLGVLTNGNSSALNSKFANIYFPENGTGGGKVKVKSAWVRLIFHNIDNTTYNVAVSTGVGSRATTTALTYVYNPSGTAVKPSSNIIHIIPVADYSELESANAVTPITVGVAAQHNNTLAGFLSAELMITYAYGSESDGYLTNLQIFGGQSSVSPATTTVETASNLVIPEVGGKTILAGGILSSFLSSYTSAVSGLIPRLDANISSTNPTCTPSAIAATDGVNSFTEFYKNVTPNLGTTDDESYNTCYNHYFNNPLYSTFGARMNGIVTYTYSWVNEPPTGDFNSAAQKNDGSGIVDISIEIDDPNDDEVRAKLEFATGTTCVFSPSGDPTLDETDANITADFADPDIDNASEYQIGTVDAYIKTASGSNSVFFDWLAYNDLPNVEGDYCLQLTANDMALDQEVLATTTVYIDNIKPTAPGALSLYSRTGTSLTLNLGATTTETNFREYIIYYKPFDGTAPDEGDTAFSSTTDINLFNKLFNGVGSTTISSGLVASTTYSLAIWVYDSYGNRASSSFVNITTNDAPTGVFNKADTKQKTNGSGIADISIEVDDLNNHDQLRAKIDYVVGTSCDFTIPLDPTLDETDANVTADFGDPDLHNGWDYQVGTSGAWILTSPGSNTVNFDWLSYLDEPEADGGYCLRLTVNDSFDDQLLFATTTLTLDNVAPTSTGALAKGVVTSNSITLVYATGDPGEDTNEPTTNAYKIFYKQGTSGVTEGGVGMTEVDRTDLNAYDYNGATSTKVTGLAQNTWYVFNIWTYDSFGNKASATEIAIKTNAPIVNESLTFTNPFATTSAENIVMGGSGVEYNFRAVVSESNGWTALASTTLRLADKSDNVSPFGDLKFYWNQTADQFYESGSDVLNAVTLSGNSSSTCAVNTCILDFKLIFNKNFASTSIEYTAELLSGNDSNVIDLDSYTDFYQVTFPFVKQIHYRWRNNDGGE